MHSVDTIDTPQIASIRRVFIEAILNIPHSPSFLGLSLSQIRDFFADYVIYYIYIYFALNIDFPSIVL